MTILKILTLPHPALKTVCNPVESVTPDIRRLMEDMLETMYDDNGIGLSANQVGVLKRVLVMDVPKGCWEYAGEDKDGVLICRSAHRGEEERESQILMMANPEIVQSSEEKSKYQEGCLSIPGQFADVIRPAYVTVKWLDQDGKEQVMDFKGLDSHCVQHEIDHLNGVVFTDHLSRLKRSTLLKRLDKYKKQRGME